MKVYLFKNKESNYKIRFYKYRGGFWFNKWSLIFDYN